MAKKNKEEGDLDMTAEVQVEQESKQEQPKAEMVPGLSIRAFAGSFCRCGRYFTKEPTVIPLSSLTDQEIARLKSEPHLAVTEVNI